MNTRSAPRPTATGGAHAVRRAHHRERGDDRMSGWLQDQLGGRLGGAVGSLSAGGWRALGTEIAAVADGLMQADLADVLVTGWKKHSALVAAAQRTADTPGSSEIVELATHEVEATHHLPVELLLDDRPVATLEFTLSVRLRVRGVVAVVRAGALTGVGSPTVRGTITLAGEDVELATRSGEIEAPFAGALKRPIQLRSASAGSRHSAAVARPPLWPAS